VPGVRPLDAQVAIKWSPSGFNLFSVEQDVEVGRQSAVEFERQVPLSTSARTEQFLTTLVSLLCVPQVRFPIPGRAAIQTRSASSSLPGGPTIDRSLIDLARSEAELAGSWPIRWRVSCFATAPRFEGISRERALVR
jgi:hypothetical protein